MLLAYIISGSVETATASRFLENVAPTLEKRLHHWPPVDISTLSVIDEAYSLVTHGLDGKYPITVLRDMRSAQAHELTPQIREGIVFNTRVGHLSQSHPIIAAMIEGINATLLQGLSFTVYSTLSSNVDSLHRYLSQSWSGHHVSSWKQVIPLLDQVTSAGSVFEMRERGFMAGLFRFLHKGADNCHMFLRATTGSEYTPLALNGVGARIKVVFTNAFAIDDNACAFFHTCSRQMDILHPESTAAIFLQAIPHDLSESTDFDNWLSAILSEGEFNAV
ncbi:hypothetical protein BT96DRAFT_1004377 [Gymnopus androsaceus JB14]|uniref:Uncharacterized protein n=1 Tax=Gymnopus androsaceus JB14 TaxID=1447944 RepID=A0A6A4GR28_9AGAR|nr:hypothetical protein BT96DRAFT_1004377 [Gymnopus androsaceus JB14]